MTLRASIAKFLVPEDELSAKLIFDNVRNYLICAASLAVALWVHRGAPEVPRFPWAKGYFSISATALFVLLLAVNLGQSLVILQRAVMLVGVRLRPIALWLAEKPRPIAIAGGVLFLFPLMVCLGAVAAALAMGVLFALIYLVLFSGLGIRPF